MDEDADEKKIPMGRHGSLYMKLNTPKGRGVFASTQIPRGSLIETCPVLILPRKDVAATSTTLLDSYTYNWPDPSEPKLQTQAVVLGLGSMFNHSARNQNVGWSRSLADQVIVYTALRDIEAHEELCINYGKLWFGDADEAPDSEEETADQILGRIEAGVI